MSAAESSRMATERDVEHPNQTSLNVPGPSASQNTGRGSQVAESHGRLCLGLSEQRVELTVLRVINVPKIKKCPFLKERIFVAISNPEITAKTEDARLEGQTAEWNQSLNLFLVQPSSHLSLTLCLYAKRFTQPDILIGTHEMPIPLASQSDIPCVLENDGREAARSTQPVTVYIKVNITPNLYKSLPSIPTEDGYSPGCALHQADEAMKRIAPIDRSNTWERAVRRIKWVMDTLGPVTGLSPFAKMAHGLLSAIPKALLEQYERDDNVQNLLRAIHDAFDFANYEDTLKSIKPQSEQARILALMLQDVCSCCDFIRSYAKDSQFWRRTLRNIDGGSEKKIKDLSNVLVKRRKAFLDQATISTEITAFQILNDVANMSTQLQSLSDQVSDAELDAYIREMPYGFHSRFSPVKGCFMGTRVALLESIINWVNNPALGCSLVLFGQAGTGKSSIAHEIARRFDEVHRLTSSFFFLRREQSVREAYHLFTTLARDLADRYPSFKIALRKFVKNNTALRLGTGTYDYDTLFESLILEPLKDLHIVGPIIVVIDGLDESGDTTSRTGLHAFLVENLIRLPSNFRVVITSRPEHAIVSAFVGAKSIHIKYMDDTELASRTHEDILDFFRQTLALSQLSYDESNEPEALTVKSEGWFLWAATAIQMIQNPPAHFDYSAKNCIKYLLEPSTNRHGQGLLDELYKEILEGHLKDQEARNLFRSVVGQLVVSVEPKGVSDRQPVTGG